MKIGLDFLGSDTPPQTLLKGALLALSSLPPSFSLCCLVPSDQKGDYLPFNSPRLEWIEAALAIEMGDDPLHSIRKKKGSSLHLGVLGLRDKKWQAFVTAGNTGALTALTRLYLPLSKGLDRPCLLAAIPTKKGETFLVDVGASSLLDDDHLIQFANLGVAYLKTRRNITHPKVALLNIGVESIKGTPKHRKVFEALSKGEGDFNFVGNIEGRDLFLGEADLVVTDGFTGNIFLKTAEGMAQFLIEELTGETIEEFNLNQALATKFKDLSSKLMQSSTPGAILLGVEPILIKCHGLTTASTFSSAILQAASLLT